MFKTEHPFAIAMWDFSWIERRWPGAGYEDWDRVLSELKERGYDAVRIDPFPHLMACDPKKEWTLKPVWNQQAWGSPALTCLKLLDGLRDFLRACQRHQVKVGLSTWFRHDLDETLMRVRTPGDHADIWIRTLDLIKAWGEADNILYVDLCNEWPLGVWAPFFTEQFGEQLPSSPDSVRWMREAIACFKAAYPDIPVTFSFTGSISNDSFDVRFLDFIEQHTWMTTASDFYTLVGYNYERFDDAGYINLALKGELQYQSKKEYYDQCLVEEIRRVADWASKWGKPLVSTECWSVVDYKDWPLLNWGWILDLNRLGVETAVKTGCWAGMATCNFCGPQFVGMWREKDWHISLTRMIHQN